MHWFKNEAAVILDGRCAALSLRRRVPEQGALLVKATVRLVRSTNDYVTPLWRGRSQVAAGAILRVVCAGGRGRRPTLVSVPASRSFDQLGDKGCGRCAKAWVQWIRGVRRVEPRFLEVGVIGRSIRL